MPNVGISGLTCGYANFNAGIRWATRGRGIGFDYVHSLVDGHSRLAYSEILPGEKGPTCAAFLLRAASYFADHGITTIRQVMTDNHLSYSRSRHSSAQHCGP